jgi:thiol-disulfide isomerase/thioredoxin
MKKTIIIMLLTLVCTAGLAKTFKTIKAPEAMACANVYQGELKASEVMMTDTATTIRFTMQYPKGQSFRFVKGCYLKDEAGNRYSLRSAEGIALDTWVQSPESGMTDFTMHFEPMPKHVQIFDFIEGDVRNAFMLLGIHDKEMEIKAPTLQQLYASNPYALPSDWLKTDHVTIRGRIEGYDAERFGFTAMESYVYDVTKKNNGTLLIEIEPDGTFEKQILLSYPMKLSFYASENSKVGFYEIPFFARPGETIDITVRPNERGCYECFYNNGSSQEVERWLKSDLRLQQLGSRLSRFEGNFNEANLIAEQVWQNMLERIKMISRRDHFTPMEIHLALGEMQSIYALALMDYAMYHEDRLSPLKENEDGSWTRLVTDSVELQTVRDVNNYKALQRIDFDNPLLLMNYDFFFTLNRIQYAGPVRKAKNEVMEDEDGTYVYDFAKRKLSIEKGNAMLGELTGKRGNLTAQLCVLNDMQSSFDLWRQNEVAIPIIMADTTIVKAQRDSIVANIESVSNMYPLYLSALTHPYVRQKAEAFYQARMSQTELTSPLPEGPGAEIIRNVIAKYPGRYLMIDFWGMGCGPCRAAIQSSKSLRAEIAKRDDVKLIFIAGERTTEGSEAYKKYVAEWLAGEETVCVSNDDFRRLQELLEFSGIPHYETFTPDGRRVREDIQLHGLHNFDFELQSLKERLK